MDTTRRSPTDLLLLDASVQSSRIADETAQPLDDYIAGGVVPLLKHKVWRHRNAAIRTHDVGLIRKPFNKAIMLRMLGTRHCWFEDEQGSRFDITLIALARLGFNRVRAQLIRFFGRRVLLRRMATLRASPAVEKTYGPGKVLYLRTDLIFGLKSGGSVTHIAGVINQLALQPAGVRFISTDVIPMVSPAIDLKRIRPDSRLWDVPEANALLMNLPAERELIDQLAEPRPRFVYQRYSANSLLGLLLAERMNVPFVLEYNGSEVWINRHWGRALNDERIAVEIEQLNLMRADLIVVVSETLARELYEIGIPIERVLVNPNGVDPDIYHPDIVADDVRDHYGIAGRTVIGFIGTFGPWHGAEVLVEALAELLRRRSAVRSKVALLLIGDGQQLGAVTKAVEKLKLQDVVVFAGRVPQQEGPAHLAACDILMSPHVPNPDGSAFFGSPTKLFEYMAIGRPIVASDLDQIGEVLAHEENALLVPPNNASVIADAVLRLLDQPELGRTLARNAREAVLSEHTWQRHTDRILARLDKVLDAHTG